jgi:hypothetical protein
MGKYLAHEEGEEVVLWCRLSVSLYEVDGTLGASLRHLERGRPSAWMKGSDLFFNS